MSNFFSNIYTMSVIIRPVNGGIIRNGLLHRNGVIIDNINRNARFGNFLRGKLDTVGNPGMLIEWVNNPMIMTVYYGTFVQNVPTVIKTYVSDEIDTNMGVRNINLYSGEDLLVLEVEFNNQNLINLKLISSQ